MVLALSKNQALSSRPLSRLGIEKRVMLKGRASDVCGGSVWRVVSLLYEVVDMRSIFALIELVRDKSRPGSSRSSDMDKRLFCPARGALR